MLLHNIADHFQVLCCLALVRGEADVPGYGYTPAPPAYGPPEPAYHVAPVYHSPSPAPYAYSPAPAPYGPPPPPYHPAPAPYAPAPAPYAPAPAYHPPAYPKHESYGPPECSKVKFSCSTKTTFLDTATNPINDKRHAWRKICDKSHHGIQYNEYIRHYATNIISRQTIKATNEIFETDTNISDNVVDDFCRLITFVAYDVFCHVMFVAYAACLLILFVAHVACRLLGFLVCRL